MKRLRHRLLAAYLLAVVPLIALAAIASYLTTARQLDAELGQRLTDVAGVVADRWSSSSTAGRIDRLEADAERSRARLEDELRIVRDAADLRRVRLVDLELRTLADTEPGAPMVVAFDLEADRYELGEVADGARAHTVLFRDVEGVPYKRGYAPIVLDGEVIAALVVEGSLATFVWLDAWRWATLALVLGVIGFVVLVTWLVSARITAPLSRLTRRAEAIGSGRLDEPIDTTRDDEIGQLGRTLEQMRCSLAARDEDRQMMLAGIAHEVRNPLGGMELFVGLLEESLESGDERREWATRVRRELDHLTRVVGDFLAFARDRALDLSRFEARRLVDEVVDAVRPVAERREVEVATSVDDGLALVGDFEALRGVVHNLTQNAIQASDAGATVRLDVTTDARGAVVTVVDRGAGMPEDVLNRVFQPFFTTREKGTGLGLPLARRIAERHGGSLDITSVEGEGTTATLRWPPMAVVAPSTPPSSSGAGPGGGVAGATGPGANDPGADASTEPSEWIGGDADPTPDGTLDPDDGMQMIG